MKHRPAVKHWPVNFLSLGLALVVLCAVPAPAAGQRVASVFLCTDEYVFRLVPRSRIAALSFLSGDRRPVVSTIIDQIDGIPLIAMSAEAVLAARPDLVVLQEGTSTNVRNLMRAAGIEVVDVAWAESLDDIRAVTRRLGVALGVPERGEFLLAEMDARLASVRAAALDPPIKTLLYEPNGYTVSGGLTDAMMRVAGLANMAPEVRPTRQGTVSVEMVVAMAPELLIFNGESERVDSRARQMLHHPALGRLGAVTHQEWFSLTPLLCPGPWSVAAAEQFVQAGRHANGLAEAPTED